MQISADAVAPGSSAKAVQGAFWQKYVARCATGDQAAFAALYDESSRLVYSLILMSVRNPADAEEVTLDVFTTVWNSAHRYDDSRGGVFGWLVMLARSRAIDRIRSRAWRQQREDSSDFLACVATEQRGQLLEALETLTPAERRVLRLAFFEGHTHRELAELLQQPLGTVKTIIRSVMMKLRNQLELLAGSASPGRMTSPITGD